LSLISQFSLGSEHFGAFQTISKHWVTFWWILGKTPKP